MTNSPNWSGASARCRPLPEGTGGNPASALEWRPSRWLIAALPLLGLLAAISVLASSMPATVAWPAAAGSAAWGLWLARRESRRPRLQVRLRGSGPIEIDGTPVEDFQVAWRGVLAFVSWRDGAGRRQRRTWCPDVLPPGGRRELRLATPVENPARASPSMAP